MEEYIHDATLKFVDSSGMLVLPTFGVDALFCDEGTL